jgi:DNA polymerase III alpha subunit (gram-positive type)
MLDETLRPVREFSSLIAPWDGAEIVPAAMTLNRIAMDELRNAPSVDMVLVSFEQAFGLKTITPAPVLGGWNVWFDAAFLRNMYERSAREWPFSHRLIDVQSVVSFYSLFADLSQHSVIEALLGEQQSHRAFDDARHTARILQLLAERYLTAASDVGAAIAV